MTQTLTGADIRGYYSALGIQMPSWAHTDGSVRCFADPGSHQRGDRDPSCSVNLEHGAWNCHACGARGGAYDAALARGCTARDAIDLMVAFGLTKHRAHHRTDDHVSATPRPSPAPRQEAAVPSSAFMVTEYDLVLWQENLLGAPRLLNRLSRTRGWSQKTIRELEIGVDRAQITIPTRNQDGRLNGLLRYRPWPQPGQPKLMAAPGSRRTLIPHPAVEPSRQLLLVEGEPDMIAARSVGLPAIAIPGANSWHPEWAHLLTGRQVTIIADADDQGRSLAQQISRDLAGIADIQVLDLAPERTDGYDLTDWLVEE